MGSRILTRQANFGPQIHPLAFPLSVALTRSEPFFQHAIDNYEPLPSLNKRSQTRMCVRFIYIRSRHQPTLCSRLLGRLLAETVVDFMVSRFVILLTPIIPSQTHQGAAAPMRRESVCFEIYCIYD